MDMIMPKTLSPWLIALQETEQFKAYATMKDGYAELQAWGNTLGLCYQLEQECRWVEKHYPGGIGRVLAAIPAHTLTIFHWKLEQEREGQTVFIGAPYSHIVGFDRHILDMQAVAARSRTRFSPAIESNYSPLERLCMGVDWRQSMPDIHIGLKLLQKALELFLFQQIWNQYVGDCPNQAVTFWKEMEFQEEAEDMPDPPFAQIPFRFLQALWQEWHLLRKQAPDFVERVLPAVQGGYLTGGYTGCFYGQLTAGDWRKAGKLSSAIKEQLGGEHFYTPAEWFSDFISSSLSRFQVGQKQTFAARFLISLLNLYRKVYPLSVEFQIHPLSVSRPEPAPETEVVQ